MFLLRWILSFGLRREQPKTRRAKELAKPQLEELTQRILLSAAASPQMAEEAMQMVATMMEERYQLIVTVEDNFVQTYDTYIQRLAQLWASDVQQWKQFVGIAPPPSGSGSGSGTISTTNDSTNQPPVAVQPKSGSGMGSGATTSHENPSRSGSMPMSGSCGSGSGPIPEVYFGSGSNPFPEEPPMCGTVVATRSVILSEATCHPVTVYYTTVDGTATAGTDYTYTSGSLTIPAGQVSPDQPIKITILDDGNDESGGTQYFDVELTGAQGATVGTPNVSEVDITEGLQQKATDTLYWNPCMDNNASTVTNWYDYTQGFQLQNGALGPTSSSPIVLDGTPYSVISQNAPINWDKSFTVASISVQKGYSALQTVYAGDTLEMDAANGSTLNVDSTSVADYQLDGGCNLQTDNGIGADDGTLDIDSQAQGFVRTMNGGKVSVDAAQGNVRTVNGGVFNMDKNYTLGAGDKINVINGGTLNVSLAAGGAQSSGGPINVTNGALNIGDGKDSGNYSTFKLTSAAADINIGPNGSMKVYQTGNTAIDNSANPGAVIANNGTVTLQGVTGARTTQLSVPLQNHKTLNVNGGAWRFTLKDASGNDISMDAGSINMTDNATIFISDAFTQTAGVLNIMDNEETIGVAVVGASENFNGGTIEFTDPIGPDGVLALNNAAFNGVTLNMRIQADSDERDLVSVGEKCTIKAGTSTINVTLVGTQTGYTSWTLIETNDGITGDFNSVNLPSGIFEEHPNNDVWACQSTD